MRYKMILVICLIIFGFIYCQKESADNYKYKSRGIITGQDFRMCPSPCCGGWFIKIDSLTYEFDSLPAGSNINMGQSSFPLAVKLDWALSNSFNCPSLRISIQKIARE
jgi:hypothetical protein